MKRLVVAGLAAILSTTFSLSVSAEEVVKVGVNGVVSDAAFFIAQEKGYFAQQGIKVEFVHFDSGPQMVAPLGTGQSMLPPAHPRRAFNAVARGIGLKVVADKGSAPVGYSYVPIWCARI